MSEEAPPTRAPPRRFTLRLTTILVVLGIAMAGWLVVSGVLLRGTNCGGNSAASCVCRCFAGFAANEARKAPGLKLADLDWTEASQCSQNPFAAECEFLIAPPEAVIDPSRRDVVIVCRRAFDNVPRPWIDLPFWRHWAHAVGYSNGEAGLISPAEYARLDLSGFVPAEEWPGAN